MRLSKSFSALAAATLISATALGTAAQTPPAAAPVSPERQAMARELIAASGGGKQLKQVLQAMFGSINKVALSNLPPAQQRLQASLQKELQAQLIAIAPQLMDVTANIYAETLSEKELRDYLAWMNSDSGRSIRDKLPLITNRSMQATLPLVMATMPKVLKAVVDRACEEAHCTAQDRQIVADALAKSTPKQPS